MDTITVVPDQTHRRRYAILAVLCLSLFLIVVDNTIVNVALPTLVRDLSATSTQLAWVVDAYSLVFAGLLLAMGSLGDRYGRKGALALGLVAFIGFSTVASFTHTPGQLIAARAAMGLSAALIFPATLAILANVFADPVERAKAIGIWSAVVGAAVALGPISGGFLLKHFWWGSVFLVNLPIGLVALALGWHLIPNSRDPEAPRLDTPGLVLSAVGVTTLVYAVIEGPKHGWTSFATLGLFIAAALAVVAFVWWERRTAHPMLDVTVFANSRFSAASGAVTLAFFALFGFIFMLTQYLQFVRGYDTLSAGLRTLPFAIATGIAAPIAPRLAHRFGTKRVVAAGLAFMSAGLVIAATCATTTPYRVIALAAIVMGLGLGLTTSPATESIMGSLPKEKAGVGSAVNDATREVGGTLGVAVIGSLLASVYSGRLDKALAPLPLPASAKAIARESVGAAFAVAERAGQTAGPQAAQAVRQAAANAFVDGFHVGALVAAAVALAGAGFALRFLPARAAAGAPTPVLELAPDALVAVD